MVCVVRSEIPLRYENGRTPDRKPLLEQASHMELVVRKLGEALQISSIMQVSQTLKITVNKMNTTFKCGRQLYRSYFLAPFPKQHRHPPTSSIYQGASVLCMLQEPLGNTLDHAVLTQLPQGLRPRFQVASTCHRCDAFFERIWTQTIPYKYPSLHLGTQQDRNDTTHYQIHLQNIHVFASHFFKCSQIPNPTSHLPNLPLAYCKIHLPPSLDVPALPGSSRSSPPPGPSPVAPSRS